MVEVASSNLASPTRIKKTGLWPVFSFLHFASVLHVAFYQTASVKQEQPQLFSITLFFI